MYWYKFNWNGKTIRAYTKQGNDKVARTMESAHRTALAKGEVGILEREPAPTLTEFLKGEFLPFIESHFVTKPKTAAYYSYGVRLLVSSDLGKMRLDEITSQHSAAFMARNAKLSLSTINCGLRSLRRALNLASEWGKLDRPPKVDLAKGERQRDRIVTEAEFHAYRDACLQPWMDVATLLYGTGMRPSEAYRLRWERVSFKGQQGTIQVAEGKSMAARRFLPMLPEVYDALKFRWEVQGRPEESWVFPSISESGHLEQGSSKNQHAGALKKLKTAHDAYIEWIDGEGGGNVGEGCLDRDWLGHEICKEARRYN